MEKANSFIKQFTTALNGDNAEVLAQKAWRKAESALKVQIASKEGDTIRYEDAVEEAKERLEKARINGGRMIDNGTSYIDTLISAKNRLVEAEEELEFHLKTLEFLRKEYAALQSE